MEKCPHLHLGVVAMENRAFGASSTKGANFTYFLQSNGISAFMGYLMPKPFL